MCREPSATRLRLAAALACLTILPLPAAGQQRLSPGAPVAAGQGAWSAHPAPHGDIRHLNLGNWRGGHWWQGDHRGRRGWWWIVGADFFWYPAATGDYPDPYTPAGLVPGWYYWCPDYRQYYPLVGDCPSAWQAVPPQ